MHPFDVFRRLRVRITAHREGSRFAKKNDHPKEPQPLNSLLQEEHAVQQIFSADQVNMYIRPRRLKMLSWREVLYVYCSRYRTAWRHWRTDEYNTNFKCAESFMKMSMFMQLNMEDIYANIFTIVTCNRHALTLKSTFKDLLWPIFQIDPKV